MAMAEGKASNIYLILKFDIFEAHRCYSSIEEGKYYQRTDFDIMEFENCLFDLQLLPHYENPCPDDNFCFDFMRGDF